MFSFKLLYFSNYKNNTFKLILADKFTQYKSMHNCYQLICQVNLLSQNGQIISNLLQPMNI